MTEGRLGGWPTFSRSARFATRIPPELVAPPYDVVSPAERERLLARDPHNVAHLTLAADETSAGDVYRAWLDEGVLVQEERPALWVWEQRFAAADGGDRRRLGIVASLRAEPYERHVVLPHERTHAGPIESRLRLLRAVMAQLEPLFFLYDGEPPLRRPDREPDLEAQGTRLWRLDDGRAVAEFFAERQVLIADGHHRYETALAYAAEQGDTEPRLLAVLVSSDDPGLEILATHRVFSGRPDLLPEGEPYPSVAAGLEALAAAPLDRSAALVYRDGAAARSRRAWRARRRARRPRRSGGDLLHRRRGRGGGARGRGWGRLCVPDPSHAHSRSVRPRACGSGDAAEGDALLPEAHVRSALHPLGHP